MTQARLGCGEYGQPIYAGSSSVCHGTTYCWQFLSAERELQYEEYLAAERFGEAQMILEIADLDVEIKRLRVLPARFPKIGERVVSCLSMKSYHRFLHMAESSEGCWDISLGTVECGAVTARLVDNDYRSAIVALENSLDELPALRRTGKAATEDKIAAIDCRNEED